MEKFEKNLSFLEVVWLAALTLAPLDAVLLLPYKVGGFSLSVVRLLVLAAIALSLLMLAARGRVRVVRGNLVLGAYLMWLGWNVASGLWAVSELAYIRYLFLIIMYGALVIFVLHLGQSLYKYDIALKVVWLVVLTTVAFGILELISGYRVPASRQWAFRNEIVSLFINPSHFGGALAMFAPFVLMYPIWSPRRSFLLVVTAAALLALLGYLVVRSGSRGAVLGLLFGCGVAVAISLFRRRVRRSLVMLAAVSASFVLVVIGLELGLPLPEALSSKLNTLWDPVSLLAGEIRIVLWQIGWQFWMESPVVGWGAGASEYLMMERASWLPAYSLHGWGIEILINTGLIGAVLWTVFVLTVVSGLLRHLWRSDSWHTCFVASSLLGGMAASAAIAFTVGSLITFPLFWVHLGLCAALASRRVRGESTLMLTHAGRREGQSI